MKVRLPLPLVAAFLVVFAGDGVAQDRTPSAGLLINELVAANRSGPLDDDGNSSDWVEIYNPLDRAVSLGGLFLTDDPEMPKKWALPAHPVAADSYFTVWMSGMDRTTMSAEAFLASASSIPFRTTLVKKGADWRYLVRSRERRIDTAGWTAVDFDDRGFSVGPAGFGYGDEDDATELEMGTTAVLLRHEFTLEAVPSSNVLVLQVDYDDGFVAYLNGTRIAAVNAPDGEPRLDSVAIGNHEAGAAERFDISQHSELLKPGKNVLAVAGLNGGAGSSDMSIHVALGTLPPVCHASFRLKKGGAALYLMAADGTVVDEVDYPRQATDQSLGRLKGDPESWGYFLTPSPGAPNLGPQRPSPVKSRLRFSPKPGARVVGTMVRIEEKSSVDVEVRFTTGGSEPTAESSVFEEPIVLDETTVFRAATFIGDERVSDVRSATYLIGRRPALPVVSITMQPSVFEDIHLQRTGRGRGSERPAYFELFSPNGKRKVSTGFGIRLHGGAGRRGGMETKKSYRAYFRKTYGGGRLDYPIIPHADVDFDKLVFRANFGDGRGHGAYIRDQVIRDLHIDMGGIASNGWWCVLLINGTDHGVYNVCERMDEEFFISHLGPGQYEVIKTGNTVLNGTREAWDNLRQFIDSTDFSIPENYDKLVQQVDIENFTAYMILNMWVQNFDWPHNNWYAARSLPDGKWKFLCWDAEWGFWGGPYREDDDPYAFIDSGAAYGTSHGRSLLFALWGNTKYREYYQNEVRRHLAGALAQENVLRRVRQHASAIEHDIEHEFDARRYDKRHWHRTIRDIETFARQRGEKFQRYTDEYFAREHVAPGDDRVAFYVRRNGGRVVVYRRPDGHLRQLVFSTDDKEWAERSLTESSGAPPAVGRPTAFALTGRRFVLYRDMEGHLQLLSQQDDADTEQWTHIDLTKRVALPLAGYEPTIAVVGGVPHIVYVDRHSQPHEVWLDDGKWRRDPMPAGPVAASEAVATSFGSGLRVTYRTRFGLPVEYTLNQNPNESGYRRWSFRLVKRLPSVGRPVGAATGQRRFVVYRAASEWPNRKPFLFHHIVRDLRVPVPSDSLIRAFEAGEPFRRLLPVGDPPPKVAGDPSVVRTPDGRRSYVVFRDQQGHILEAEVVSDDWTAVDTTSLAKAPDAVGEPAGFIADDGARYYVYRGDDGNLHELQFRDAWRHRVLQTDRDNVKK